MTDSCFSSSRDSRMILSHYLSGRTIQHKKSLNIISFLMIVCMTAAICLAPESPEQLASICERHNPEIACLVW